MANAPVIAPSTRHPDIDAPGLHEDIRILVVDDNCELREYVGRLLRRWWIVEAVGDGATALEAIRRQRPTLVLADAAMSGLDGTGMLGTLQGDPVARSIPMIVLSENGGVRDVDPLDANDRLLKPFSSRELIGHVSARLEQLLGRPVRTQRPVRRLLNRIGVPIAIVRGDAGIVENANRAYLELIGGRDGIGRPFADLVPDGGFAHEAVSRALASGTNQVMADLTVPQRGHGKPTDTHWSFVFTPVSDESGGASRHVVAIGVDVTDDVRARERRDAVAADAISANMAKDEFLAALGHELRNPLSSILMGLQLMRTKGVVSHELDVMDRQIAIMVRLIDDLLDVSRIARGQIELHKERIAIAEVVGRAVESVDPLLKERQQRLTVLVPATGLDASVDPARMTQVFANLLTNAAKYSERETEITVRAVREDHHLRVSVEDHGIGIPTDMLPHVFDAFAQEPSAARRSRGGLGLGLAIVRHLVTLHDGGVTAHSDGLGSGSTFSVVLPVNDAATTGQPSTEHP